MEDSHSIDEGTSEVSYGQGTIYQFNTRRRANKPVSAQP
jgi:hypothetical protein